MFKARDHENITIESQRIRTTKSKVRTTSVHVSVSHNNIFEAMEIPAAKVAVNKDWLKWRTKQFSLCGMEINTTLPPVDQTLPQFNTPQIIHGSCATITIRNHMNHIRRTFQNRCFALNTLNINGGRDLKLRTLLV